MHTSLYENLYRKIALDIRTGRLEPDSKLPSIRGYAEEHAISKNTVINAYNLLLSEGYIYSKEKSGFYVSKMETGLYAEAKQNRIETEIKDKISEPILDLSSNLVDSTNFPYSTLRQLYREALSKTSISLLDQAGDLFGEKDLRKSIADFVYTHKGINCTYEQVVIGNGTAYHLNKIAVMFDQKGTFLMEEPTFQSTLQIIKDTGINIIQIKQDKEGINLAELKKSGEVHTGIQFLHISPSHQFPMGTTMSAPRRSSVLSWAYSADQRYIIEDDYDSDFRYIGHPIPSLQSMDTRERVIYVGTFSRTLTPALRISYMILPKQLVKKYEERFYYYQCPVSRIDQRVLSLFIDQGYFVRHINRMRRLYKSKRDYMLSLIKNKLPGVRTEGENAGLHFILRANKGENELIREANKLGLFLRGTGNGWIIIGYAHLTVDEMDKAVGILEQIISSK